MPFDARGPFLCGVCNETVGPEEQDGPSELPMLTGEVAAADDGMQNPDEELEIPEPTKEMSSHERQTTYRAGAKLWLKSFY